MPGIPDKAAPTGPSVATYAALLQALKVEIANARLQIQTLQARTYWNVGRSISRHLLANKHRATYGKQLFSRLAASLKISEPTLHRTVKFYERYPILAPAPELPWSHYRALIAVGDPARRRRLERLARGRHLSKRELADEIKASRAADSDGQLQARPAGASGKPAAKLAVTRGQLNIYKVLATLADGRVVVDCGFDFRIKIKNGVAAGVTLGQTAGYTYKARVERVIDGDTLVAIVDLGFDAETRQKLRLAGIDAPEAATPAGRRAKAFVARILKACEFVVVKTYKDDKYGRYLADVYYQAGEADAAKVAAEGAFLNQELLDGGWAGVWEG